MWVIRAIDRESGGRSKRSGSSCTQVSSKYTAGIMLVRLVQTLRDCAARYSVRAVQDMLNVYQTHMKAMNGDGVFLSKKSSHRS